MEALVTIVVLVVLGVVLFALTPFKKFVVEAHERGVLFKNGRFITQFEAGGHWCYGFGMRLETVDLRRRTVTVPGQELITADGVGIKVSLVMEFEVRDAVLALMVMQDFYLALYSAAQLALRDVVAGKTLDEVMAERNQFGAALVERSGPTAGECGVRIVRLEVKDIMLPNELKRIYNQLAEAKQEALAELERARGRAAVTRSMLNTAKLYEEHPQLAQMRLLDAVSQGGNTIVVGSNGVADVLH